MQNNFYIDISDHYRQHNLEKQNVHQREVFLLEKQDIFDNLYHDQKKLF